MSEARGMTGTDGDGQAQNLIPVRGQMILVDGAPIIPLSAPARFVSVLGVGGNSGVSARRAQCPNTWSSARA